MTAGFADDPAIDDALDHLIAAAVAAAITAEHHRIRQLAATETRRLENNAVDWETRGTAERVLNRFLDLIEETP